MVVASWVSKGKLKPWIMAFVIDVPVETKQSPIALRAVLMEVLVSVSVFHSGELFVFSIIQSPIIERCNPRE
jgi:hypothetical protein